jgi:hypothetical protein
LDRTAHGGRAWIERSTGTGFGSDGPRGLDSRIGRSTGTALGSVGARGLVGTGSEWTLRGDGLCSDRTDHRDGRLRSKPVLVVPKLADRNTSGSTEIRRTSKQILLLDFDFQIKIIFDFENQNGPRDGLRVFTKFPALQRFNCRVQLCRKNERRNERNVVGVKRLVRFFRARLYSFKTI